MLRLPGAAARLATRNSSIDGTKGLTRKQRGALGPRDVAKRGGNDISAYEEPDAV